MSLIQVVTDLLMQVMTWQFDWQCNASVGQLCMLTIVSAQLSAALAGLVQ